MLAHLMLTVGYLNTMCPILIYGLRQFPTRNYLKRVMTYAVIYEQRLGMKSSPMFEHMAPTAIDYTAAVF